MTKRKRAGLAAAGGVLLAVLIGVAVCSQRGREEEISASGTVEATEIELGFQVPGRIERVAVREGDRVEAGQELAWLDRRELEARVRSARAQLAAARARLAELEEGFRPEEVEQARANLAAASQRLEDARRSLERSKRLFEGGAISREQLDREETAFAVAEAQYRAAKEQLDLMERGPRIQIIEAQRAAVRQAEATVAQAEAALEGAVIKSPISGVVSVQQRHPGEVVAAGVPVLTVIDPDDRWVRIYVRGDQVGRVSLGQEAEIRADAYPDRVYRGRVVYIADEAEFTPRNVQTREDRVRLVYRMKVAVVGDSSYDLKPGLPADVRLVALQRR
ncbi:MAG: hemolysin secretion protein D [Gemmatimonadales bacterium]|nr:MAG: hemolysin secretion protein D [Gemmatimonadales bacterium]